MMSTWGPIAYAVIAALLLRPAMRAGWRMMDTGYGSIDWGFVVLSGMFGCIFAGIWPIWLPFELIKRKTTAAQFFATVAGESRSEKLKRKEREMAEREAHIAKLERELGIKEAA